MARRIPNFWLWVLLATVLVAVPIACGNSPMNRDGSTDVPSTNTADTMTGG